jgi:spore germination protein YaaH/flagellar hook assembly protein FlgD
MGALVQAREASFTTPLLASPPTTAPGGLRREVFGFLPYWELGASSTVLNYGLLTTVAYFSVGVDGNGNLLRQNPDGTPTTGWAGWTSSALTAVINAAHSAGVRVVLTVTAFAWTSSQAAVQAALLDSPTARANLAQQVAAAVRDRGADGVNLDFEPIVAGRSAAFTALVRAIRAQLDAVAPGYQLTFDATGSIGNYPIEDATAPGGADAVFVMGYDYRGASSSTAGSIAPLGGPRYDITDTVSAYLARIPAAKVILGVPYYGRAWSTASDALNAPTLPQSQYGASVAVTYDTAADLLSQYGRRWDPVEVVAWTAYQRQNCTTTYGCVTSWRELYVDDPQALRAKYDLVNRAELRGVGIWALGYDGTRPELWAALADKFVRDTTAPMAGILALPASETDEGFPVSWAAQDENGIAAYDVQVSVDGGPWLPWLTGTTATGDVWLGSDGHTYAFRVRAQDGQGNWSAWDVTDTGTMPPALARGGFALVAADGLSLRAAPDTAALRLGTARAGDVLAVTGGPVSADGYTWYQVTGPLTSWGPVSLTQIGVWAAAGDGTVAYLVPTSPPNATRVQATIAGLAFGPDGPATLGPEAAGARTFSPNGDGWSDTLPLVWTNRVPLDSLVLRVWRTDGTMVGTVDLSALRSAGPQSWSWDGRVNGSVVPDGTYLLQLVGSVAGRSVEAPSAQPVTPSQIARYGVTVDTVPPVPGPVAVSSTAFSPNGDGRRDTVTVRGAAAGASRWAFWVRPVEADGTLGPTVRQLEGQTSADGSAAVVWDGRTDGGAVAPDGTYALFLRLMDVAGNGTDARFDVLLDTRPPSLSLAATPGRFSPNGDGQDDRVTLTWTTDEAVSGSLRIRSGTRILRTWPVTGTAGGSVVWDGRSGSGVALPDGRYTVELVADDAAANLVLRRTVVTLDRTAGFLRWSPGAFYPQDRDRLAATSRVSFRLTRLASTTLRILDGSGAVVRTAWSGRRLPAGVWGWTWDGRDASGRLVPPGRYVAQLVVGGPWGPMVLTRSVLADAFVVTLSPSAPAVGQTVTLQIRSVEPLVEPPTVTVEEAGVVGSTVTATGSAGQYEATVTLPSTPGTVSLVVAGRDTLGQVNRTILTVIITG